MEKLVLIHVDDIEYYKIQNIASRMKITVDRIPEEIVTANYKLGELVNGAYKNAADTIDGTGREQENVTGHSSETGVMNAQAKSSLTPSNQNWTVPMLMQELRRERFAMMRK